MSVMYLAWLTLSTSAGFAGEPPKTTLEEVGETLNLLDVLANDPGKEAQDLRTKCGVSRKTAGKLILPLRPLWEERIAREALELSGRDASQLPKKKMDSWKDCAKSCLCPTYSRVLERAEIRSSGTQRIHGLAKKQNEADRLACAANSTPLCGKPLIRYLRREAASFQSESRY